MAKGAKKPALGGLRLLIAGELSLLQDHVWLASWGVATEWEKQEDVMRRRVSGSISMRAEREQDVLVVVASGVITVGEFAALGEFVRDSLDAEDARAVVLDMRGAAHLLTEEGWLAVAATSARSRGSMLATPLALLVAPIMVEATRRHCRRMAASGYLRITFVERGPALAWASRRLEHWEQLPKHLAR